MDTDESSDVPQLAQLIKGIKEAIMKAAEKKGKSSVVPDDDKEKLKTNMKNHFSQPGNNLFDEAYAGPEMTEVIKAIVGSFMALGWKHNGEN